LEKSPHNKSPIRALPRTSKIENPFFVARQKTIVATVVGNGKMHNPTKYGAKIQIFPFESPKP
jgi:hypothetical protein